MKNYDKKKKELAMKEHYSPENQRKLHYKSIKTVVKPEARPERYKEVNKAFPTK